MVDQGVRLEVNTEIDLEDVACGTVDWIQLA